MSRPAPFPRPDWRTPRVCPAPVCPRQGAPFVPDCPPRSLRFARVYCSRSCARCAQRARRRERDGLPPLELHAKTCARPGCNQPFEGHNYRQRFCSKRCRRLEEQRHRAALAHPHPREQRVCPCGVLFEVRAACRRYCSAECRGEAAPKPHRATRPAPSPAPAPARASGEPCPVCGGPMALDVDVAYCRRNRCEAALVRVPRRAA